MINSPGYRRDLMPPLNTEHSASRFALGKNMDFLHLARLTPVL